MKTDMGIKAGAGWGHAGTDSGGVWVPQQSPGEGPLLQHEPDPDPTLTPTLTLTLTPTLNPTPTPTPILTL